MAAGLSAAALGAALQDHRWPQRAEKQFNGSNVAKSFDLAQAARLATTLRFFEPAEVCGSTGVVVMGYGDDEIFPSYRHVSIHGHVGDELHYFDDGSHIVKHAGLPLIKGLAQTSMIDLFTDGFGLPLWRIVKKERVTSSFESVGGPIDVAAITNNEGLVWIKRKHFFDPSMNSRYVARQQSVL